MKSAEFCYWLQGYFELTDGSNLQDVLTPSQVQMVKRHLALVFKHEIDPSYGDKPKQDELNRIHNLNYDPFGPTIKC